MKRLMIVLCAFALALAGHPALAQSAARDPAGDWRGKFSIGAADLRIALHLGEVSTFDSPDQGANGLPAEMKVDGGVITVKLPGGNAFVGRMSADGQRLEGVLKANGAEIPLALERGTFSASARPQSPRPPFPYRVEEVAYRNAIQDVRLAGTLTVPRGEGPFPAVLLITGSGGQDRDETVFEHKPFLVLADALTRRGIAVLRVDDRGVGGSSAGPPDSTTADLATDVRAGLAWLRSRPEIDPKRVGLLGHSEGGAIATIVAAGDPSVAFALLWASPGLGGKELLVEQARALARSAGATEEKAEFAARVQRASMEAVLAAPDAAALGKALNGIMDGAGAPRLGAAEIALMASPWYRHFVAFDPAPLLGRMDLPVLALLGGTDVQIVAEPNARAFRAALAGKPRAGVEVLPGLNHLFQTSATGSPREYGEIEETIDPAALERMVGWIAEQALGGARGSPRR